VRREDGFTLIEAVMAMAIFAAVATALAGVLTSSISARSIATQRTVAEQVANAQLEWIRSLDYAEVGLTVDGNPPGLVDATGNQSAQGGPTVSPFYTVNIDIFWVNDRVPTAIDTKTSYKNVIVTVSRARDGRRLSQQSTQVGPRQRAAFGGIGKGIVNVQVVDYVTGTPFSDTLVRLNNGPSSPLGDRTDASGAVRFPGLTAATSPTYYDIVVPPSGGYEAVPDPSTTHFQLAAGATPGTKVVQLFKPVTFTADFRNSNGTPYVGTVQFTVTNARGSKNFTYVNPGTTPVSITDITNTATGATEKLVPGLYTITVTNQVAASFYASPLTLNVPASGYPSTLTGSATGTADPLGSISTTVTSAGGNVAGATVTVSGGPRSIPARSATTNASGIATISNLPEGAGYIVSAAKGGQTAPNQTAAVSGSSTTNLTFDFPVGNLKAVVTWASVKVVGATVTLSGGPGGISLTGTSDVNGEVLFSNAPAGSGYTMTATRNGQSASVSPTVVGATTTTVSIAMPTVSVLAAVTWPGSTVNGALVTLSGGPMSLSAVSATTAAPGQVTFSNVPAGSGYTLVAAKNGQSTTLTSQTFTTAPTTNVSIALPTGTISINAATWVGQPAGGASVTISGGPDSPNTYTNSADASGVVNITVPATNSSFPYTVNVTKAGGSGTAAVSSLASGATATVLPTLTQTKTFTITIQRGGSTTGVSGTSILLTFTGGPNATTYTFTVVAGAGGVLPNVTVPLGTSGALYAIKANLSTCGASAPNRSGTVSNQPYTGANTAVTINMTTTACP
jgi:prepilin-type N-terminal cleavage/methylation domain-containing protein